MTPTIDGAALLDEVEAFHRRFNVFPHEAAYVAVALWDAHAHLLDCFDSTPRLAFLSPEPGSGKSRALEIVETLVPQPMTAVNASAAALFRSVSNPSGKPTILFDEIDTIFGPKAGDNEELRGFLNAGHRRTGVTYRCIGDGGNQTVQAFPSYCAVAVAGLGSLPDTIMTRSIVIRMRRRARNETRGALPRPHPRGAGAQAARPTRPMGGTRPGVRHGRLAGDARRHHRPARGRVGIAPRRRRRRRGPLAPAGPQACVTLVTASKANDKGSLGVRLLTDLRDHVMVGIDRLPTVAILDRLNALDDAPWADLHGKPLDNRRLSRMLAEYMTADNEPIASRNIKTAGSVLKGYYAADLWDAWARYCPPPPESPLRPLPGTENAV